MTRALGLFVWMFLLAVPGLSRADEPTAATETVIRLTVSLASAPRPALKYHLLPQLREMSAGNPVDGYQRCIADLQKLDKPPREKLLRYLTTPLKDLPVEEALGYRKEILRQADEAARLDTPDWRILTKMKSEGLRLPFTDLLSVHLLLQALQVRLRGQIAGARFDDALATMQTMLALSRHLGEHPTELGYLMGLACADFAADELQEMMEQPGCPSLFWALSDLPSPLVDLRKALQGERLLFRAEFGGLDGAAPMSEAALQKMVARLEELRKLELGGKKQALRDWLAAQLVDSARVEAARKRLIASGIAADKIKHFPALQVILLDEKQVFENHSDEVMKLMELPYWQVEPLLSKLEPLTDDAWVGREIDSLFGTHTGAHRVRRAQTRLEQRLCLLRCTEALRMYAADHNDRLPARLADVPLPLPTDPFTGKPFIYKLENDTATLQGTPPPGMEKEALFNFRFLISIRK
jgi:hypothetical protein